MFRDARPGRPQTSHFIWTIGAGILLFAVFMSVVINVASASAHEVDSKGVFSASAFQRTATPTATIQSTATPATTPQIESTPVYSFSLATLGYDERTLTSPFDQAQYAFRLPENWVLQTDAVLDLDLSYVYDQVSTEGNPDLFGDLTVKLDGQTLEIFSIKRKNLDHFQWSVPLPSSILSTPDQTRHFIELTLSAGLLCDVPHRARLVIHPTSSIALTCDQRPIVPDLARYPQPFYQGAFEPDNVRFVLPSQPNASDLNNALAVAAKLGDLTGDRLVISATTDVDLGNRVSTASTAVDEHLVVIGRPQNNQLLPLLAENAELPVSLQQRQLGLTTQGPTVVAPGDTFTYVFTVTNTVDQAVEISLVNPLPRYTKLVSCAPDCSANTGDNDIIWDYDSLAPDETLSFSLTLKATDEITGLVLENTTTLIEADLGPVNGDTLTSTVVADSSDAGPHVSVAEQGDYFFVYDGQAVAAGDGIVQEIRSPWSENRAILIVTGLSHEAVRKASQAMSSETRFPGMNGTAAFVEEALSRSEISDPSPALVDMTFADLGYSDRVIRGGGTVKQIDYLFRLPYGWQLADDASIDLYFSHSQLLTSEASGLTVLLNGQPLASAAINEETANDGHLHVSLADANVRAGDTNRLTIEVYASLPGVCVDHKQAWVLIKDSSRLSLAYHEDAGLDLNLDLFPHPFHLNPALTDLLFVLPTAPTVEELEMALRLATSLGDSASGRTILPVGTMDNDLESQDLEGYQIIAIGRPSRNALLQQVNSQLPQPFLSGSDEIEQRLDDVVFRLPSNVDLGYAQLIPSSWDETRAFLAITGTTDKSVNWVTRVLTERRWTLGSGNLALIRDDDVETIETRHLTHHGAIATMATAVPEMAQMAASAEKITGTPAPPSAGEPPVVPAAAQPSDGMERPQWLIPLVGITGLIVITIFAIAFRQARSRRY